MYFGEVIDMSFVDTIHLSFGNNCMVIRRHIGQTSDFIGDVMTVVVIRRVDVMFYVMLSNIIIYYAVVTCFV